MVPEKPTTKELNLIVTSTGIVSRITSNWLVVKSTNPLVISMINNGIVGQCLSDARILYVLMFQQSSVVKALLFYGNECVYEEGLKRFRVCCHGAKYAVRYEMK